MLLKLLALSFNMTYNSLLLVLEEVFCADSTNRTHIYNGDNFRCLYRLKLPTLRCIILWWYREWLFFANIINQLDSEVCLNGVFRESKHLHALNRKHCTMKYSHGMLATALNMFKKCVCPGQLVLDLEHLKAYHLTSVEVVNPCAICGEKNILQPARLYLDKGSRWVLKQ